MDYMEIGWGGVDYIHLAEAGSCESGNEPPGSINVWYFLTS